MINQGIRGREAKATNVPRTYYSLLPSCKGEEHPHFRRDTWVPIPASLIIPGYRNNKCCCSPQESCSEILADKSEGWPSRTNVFSWVQNQFAWCWAYRNLLHINWFSQWISCEVISTLPWCKIQQSINKWVWLFPKYWYIGSLPLLCGTSSGKFRLGSHSLISTSLPEIYQKPPPCNCLPFSRTCSQERSHSYRSHLGLSKIKRRPSSGNCFCFVWYKNWKLYRTKEQKEKNKETEKYVVESSFSP